MPRNSPKSELLSATGVPTPFAGDQAPHSGDAAAPQGGHEHAAALASQPAAEKPKSSNKPKERDRHGFRGVPPPISGISLSELPDDCLLTELEVCSILRISTHTAEKWRRTGKGQIVWEILPGGLVRYRAGTLKRFVIASTVRGRCRAPQRSRLATEPIHPAE